MFTRSTIKRAVTVGGAASAVAAGLLIAGAPAQAATTTATPAPSAAAADCDRGAWAGAVQGAPIGFGAGQAGGDYLWHDVHGFHLRVTHRGDDRQIYSGMISSPTPMRMEPVKLEGRDTVALSADRKHLSFSFADYGHIDGVNFHTDCAPSITVSGLKLGNHALPATRVYLGAHRTHPAKVPFTIHRRTGR